MGVVTGIVQEFQFGMNWSAYSRFVGDIFGAPLAIEGLLAFFLESTFLGVWIFGWNRISARLHLMSIWLVAIGTMLSAAWILAANSWMQNPVGYTLNAAAGRAEMVDFGAVVANPVFLVTYPHTIFAAWATGGAFALTICAYRLLRRQETELFTRSAAIALVVTFVSSVGVAFVGHAQAQVMTRVQPMKMAAAEALWDTEAPAPFSLFAVGDVSRGRNNVNLAIPNLLSVLATNTLDGKVEGINDLQARYERQFGPGDYRPMIPITYWTFRFMVGAGLLLLLLTGIGLLLLARQRLADTRWFHRAMLGAVALPYIANTTGWIFTEVGRQPWAVWGLLKIVDSPSPTIGVLPVATTLVGYTVVYGLLAMVAVRLIARFVKANTLEMAVAAEPGLPY
jgi:cytochrome d ubiquinol oxidase subunit I